MTDGSGNVDDTYSYDSYSNLLSSTGTVTNPYHHDDGYYDTRTGLYKFGERYYSPIEMRWTQPDYNAKFLGLDTQLHLSALV